MRMRGGVLLGLSVMMMAVTAAARGQEAAVQEVQPARTFALAVENLALTDALLELHWRSGAPIVAANGSEEARVTLRGGKMTVEKALDGICDQAGFRWERSGRYYVVSAKEASRGALPPIEEDDAFWLYGERERLAAGRLLSGLDANRMVRLGRGEEIAWSDLKPAQQRALGLLYDGLGGYLKRRQSDELAAVAARKGLLGPVEGVGFSLRLRAWRMEGWQP